MRVPAAMVDLHEPDAALDQAARQEAVRGERARLAHIVAVEPQDGFGLPGNIRQLGHRGLHAKRHLVLRDARLRFRIAQRLRLPLVQRLDTVEHPAAYLPVTPSGSLR